jgi:hypothetical protein
MATALRLTVCALAAATILGTTALPSPSYAALLNTNNAPPPAAAEPAMQTSAKHMHHRHEMMADQVENRIKTLHGKLKITQEQEEAWGKVAQVMRDNETSVKSLIEERHKNASTMNAIDDLTSYQKIAQEHAAGLDKVIAAFQPLYDGMSDEQKKNADTVFSSFEGHTGHMHK